MVEQMSEETVLEIKEAFTLFDKNGDGSICTEELGMVMRALNLNPTEEHIKDLIHDYDINSNGKIDFPEFLIMMAESKDKRNTVEELMESFKVFDLDRNGFITSAELKSVMLSLGEKLTEQEVDAMMKEADLNDDGRIDYEEFANMMLD